MQDENSSSASVIAVFFLTKRGLPFSGRHVITSVRELNDVLGLSPLHFQSTGRVSCLGSAHNFLTSRSHDMLWCLSSQLSPIFSCQGHFLWVDILRSWSNVEHQGLSTRKNSMILLRTNR